MTDIDALPADTTACRVEPLLKRVLVTGAAGYVGALLAERLAEDPALGELVATDRHPRPQAVAVAGGNGKLREAEGRLEDESFLRRLESHLPIDAVVHAAFSIRAGYGRQARVIEQANLASCRNVFEFCFRNDVGRLIYFSTAAVYGARPENRPDHFFAENEPLAERTYSYGVQKRRTEELLKALHEKWRPATRVAVIRPCAITGPRFLTEPTKQVTLVSYLKKLLPVIPQVSTEWARQYLHEDDLVEAIRLLLSAELPSDYEIFNLAPPDYLLAPEIARALGKRTLRLPGWVADVAFPLLWHLSRGRVPTPRGAANFLRYPVNLDGSKITRLGFKYRYGSRQCLQTV